MNLLLGGLLIKSKEVLGIYRLLCRGRCLLPYDRTEQDSILYGQLSPDEGGGRVEEFLMVNSPIG